jgi:tetratricopeptide (TPR) repeat protein
MADEAAGAARYWAFISYSHRDAAFGHWLHRRLENYPVPRRLAGKMTNQGQVPQRLTPIFRDREEFPAATDLSAEVQAALGRSKSLIVVCSPDAAASRWVSREVELFRRLHPERPILAAIREGDPAQSFPEALLTTGPAGERIEPLAADFRAGNDGRQLGILKLVAGMTGVGLDELVQRDVQRNRQRVMAVTVGAAIAILTMSVLTAAAVLARRDAESQRAKAEGLVEYMLTDLRDRLKGVGRLDVMTGVNERALQYYTDQNLTSLSADSLGRRARLLHAMGEDDENRGDHKDAIGKFKEAERATAELLKEAPNDPERVFDQAQSVFWIGETAYEQNQRPKAKAQFLEYRSLANRMVALNPGKLKYRMEQIYAEDALCALALSPPAALSEALEHCGAALAEDKKALQNSGRADEDIQTHKHLEDELINGLANMADSYYYDNNMHEARAYRIEEEEIVRNDMLGDPKNMTFKKYWVIAQRSLALIDAKEGNLGSAHTRLQDALSIVTQMLKFDPANAEWADQRRRILRNLLSIQHH